MVNPSNCLTVFHLFQYVLMFKARVVHVRQEGTPAPELMFKARVVHVSQRMTFLYSPRPGNQSSRPVTKPTAMISKAWRPCGTSNLDRTIAPLQMQVDTVSYLRACVVRPSEMTLYKEAYWPRAVSQRLAASQP